MDTITVRALKTGKSGFEFLLEWCRIYTKNLERRIYKSKHSKEIALLRVQLTKVNGLLKILERDE